MELRVLPMGDKAGGLDLVHGIDHAGRRARLRQQHADFGNLTQRGLFAAQRLGDHDPEKAFFFERREGFPRKARLFIHIDRILGGDLGRALCRFDEIAGKGKGGRHISLPLGLCERHLKPPYRSGSPKWLPRSH